jgi:NADH dehydrogenase/NADH:ubiquinone oxidoreductase subunit G
MDANLFGDYQKLLHVEVLGREIEVPEHNTLLRGLQFAAPETISYGRFCWNGSCNNCTVTVRNGSCESKGQACTMDAREGMHVTAVSGEIRRLL